MTPLVGGAVAGGCTLAIVAVLARAFERRADGDDEVAPRHLRRADRMSSSRVAATVVVAVAVLMLTRWPVMAVAGGILAAHAGRLFVDRRSRAGIAHLEAIAVWLEELRDLLRGSSIGVDEALERSLARAGSSLGGPAQGYLEARRRGDRVDEALERFGAAVGHPLGVAAVAALSIVVRGGSGGARLAPTMASLAAAARDEVLSRQRSERVRDVYRSSMARLVVIAVVLVAYLRVASAELLAPYATVTGQAVLALPLAAWAGSLAWLDRLCRRGMLVDPAGGR